jgi:hypothetical protein
VVSVKFPEQAAPVEEELGRHQTEAAYWSYFTPCAGVKCYTYEDRAAPIKTEGPREAGLKKDTLG